MFVEFLEKTQESGNEVLVFDFEIKNLEYPEKALAALAEKIDGDLLSHYEKNESFASSTEVLGLNSKLKTLVLRIRIKGEQPLEVFLSEVISKAAHQLYN